MDTLTELQKEYSRLSDSITFENKDEHASIVRQMNRNCDAQERYLSMHDY